MRWLKWAIVVAWLGFHAWPWMLLPPVPTFQLPCDLAPTWPSRRISRQPGWEGFEDRRMKDDFAFAAGGRRIVTRDATSVSIFDTNSRQTRRAWQFKAPVEGKHVLAISPDGDRAVEFNSTGSSYAIDLTKGDASALADAPSWVLAAAFSADGKRYFGLAAGGWPRWSLYQQDFGTGRAKSVGISGEPGAFAISPNGRTAAIGVADFLYGSHTEIIRTGMELVDLAANSVSHLDEVCTFGQWLGCDFSPDGRTLVGSFYNSWPLKAQHSNFRHGPSVATWDASTGRRRATLEHAWSRGWCADGRLVIRTEDGDSYFADENLVRQSALPFPLAESDQLLVDESGRHLLVNHPWKSDLVTEFIRDRLKLNWKIPAAYWECFDLTGRRETGVASGPGGCCVSRDGRYLAVGSPDGKAVDVYTLPPRIPGGIILGLMIGEVALAIAWTAWRRRRASRRQPDVNVSPTSGLRLDARSEC